MGQHANGTRLVCLFNANPGNFSTATGAEICPIGTYTDQPNLEACISCDPTFSTAMAGSTSPNDCISKKRILLLKFNSWFVQISNVSSV